jgi:hypothetical protein
MHQMFNAPIAVNVGDAMNALALSPLFKNKSLLGPKIAEKVFLEVQL